MSTVMNTPADDLAGRILTGVGYKDRLPAGRMAARLGVMRGTVRSLPELHLYLTPDDSSLPALSLQRLADWVEQVIADPELAGRLREAHAQAPSYVDACQAARALVGERLAQARGVLAADAGRGNGEIAA